MEYPNLQTPQCKSILELAGGIVEMLEQIYGYRQKARHAGIALHETHLATCEIPEVATNWARQPLNDIGELFRLSGLAKEGKYTELAANIVRLANELEYWKTVDFEPKKKKRKTE